MADKETKEQYKSRVLETKKKVQQMYLIGQEKKIPISEINSDVEKYLSSQGLTSFELRTNGDRKNTAWMQGFTNGFNTKLMEILQVVVPEIASTLDLKKFGILNIDDLLARDEKTKKATSDMIEQLFTMQLISGQKPLIEQGFTPENLGERMADQMGETLVEFLPLMIAPELIATKGPVEGFKIAYTQNAGKLQKVADVLNNSMKTILNTYIQNPGKSFIADISASLGFGAGEEIAETMQDDTHHPLGPTMEAGFGLGGAGLSVAAVQILTSPLKTKQAIGTVFKSYFGLKPLMSKLTSGIKKRRKQKVINFFKNTMQRHEEELAQAQDITGAVDVTGKKIKLTTAEEAMSPGLKAEQEVIESKISGAELDDAVKRRVDNLNALDESLATIVPKTDKNFQYFLDLRENTIRPLIKKLEQQIASKEQEILVTTEGIAPALTKKESGVALRDNIETAQINESREVVNELNAIKGGQATTDPAILDEILAYLAREFETGTQPAVLSNVYKKIQQFLPKEVEKTITEPIGPGLGNRTRKIKQTVPAEKELTNQDMFDIWLSAKSEQTSLLGKPGINNANKIQRLAKIEARIMDQLMSNLKNVEGSPAFFEKLRLYQDKFEQGLIVRLRDKKPAGHAVRDELVADAFFQAENVGAIQDFVKVFGKDESAIYNLQQSILDRLANETIDMKTGFINVDNYKRFLTKYDSIFKELEKTMPNFVKKLQNVKSAIGPLTERLSTLNTRKTFIDGERLKNTLNVLGAETKQLKLGTVEEYVNAALADPKLMENITQRVMKADGGDAWVKSVLESLTTMRPNANTGAIHGKEIADMKKFIKVNGESLEKLFSTMGPKYKDHLKNLKLIINGFERVNYIIAPRGAPAPTPSQQMKEALGTDIPQVWSRAFAIASNRTGWKFVAAEVFNRFLNTVGIGHFDKLMKQAIYDPAFARTLANMNLSKEATVKDFKNIYGFLAKLNGTIGVVSETGEEDISAADEARSNVNIMAPTPSVSFEQPPVVPESRMAQNPVGMIGTPTQPAQMASIYPQTMAGGQPDRIDPGRAAIAFGPMDILAQPRSAAQGGIMSTNKAFQRVA